MPKSKRGASRRSSHSVKTSRMPGGAGGVMPGVPAGPGSLELRPDATPKADLKLLASLPRPSGIAPAASLTIEQLAEVERLANLKLNIRQIGVHLGIKHDVWAEIVRCNPAVGEVYESGAVRAVVAHAEALQVAALGGDSGATRYWLDRHGGPQWVLKQPKVVVVSEVASPVEPPGILDNGSVLLSVTNALDDQRKLFETNTINGEAIEDK